MATRFGAVQGRAIMVGEWRLGADSVRLGFSACASLFGLAILQERRRWRRVFPARRPAGPAQRFCCLPDRPPLRRSRHLRDIIPVPRALLVRMRRAHAIGRQHRSGAGSRNREARARRRPPAPCSCRERAADHPCRPRADRTPCRARGGQASDMSNKSRLRIGSCSPRSTSPR